MVQMTCSQNRHMIISTRNILESHSALGSFNYWLYCYTINIMLREAACCLPESRQTSTNENWRIFGNTTLRYGKLDITLISEITRLVSFELTWLRTSFIIAINITNSFLFLDLNTYLKCAIIYCKICPNRKTKIFVSRWPLQWKY